MRSRHACVIGAGIVGCASAYALARDGWRVTLVDAMPTPGQGASRANGAQLSYSYVEPLATPATLRALPGWLLSADSPLRWRPRPEWSHLRWLAAFTLACRWSQVRSTTKALLALSFLSRDVLHGWLQEQPGMSAATLHGRPGKLVIYRDPAARAGVQRQLAWQAAMGCEQQIVEADECRVLEPALATTGGGPIAFGVWTRSEEVIDAAALANELARASGAAFLFGRQVSGFEMRGDAIQAARFGQGEGSLAADHFVLATGPSAGSLLSPLGLALPIEPIKGYSVTLPIVDAAAAPRASVTDTARKLVHARLGDHLRVAGFAELCGHDRSVQARRINALCAAVQETFPGACDIRDNQAWAGLRPATPSGRPLVGPTRWANLWVNAGHGALGLTLAPGSADVLASLMGQRPCAIDADPFRVQALAHSPLTATRHPSRAPHFRPTRRRWP
jgi:D-amino-acid dehydrogenase